MILSETFFEKFDEILLLVLVFDLNSSPEVCWRVLRFSPALIFFIEGETREEEVREFVRGREATLQALLGEY